MVLIAVVLPLVISGINFAARSATETDRHATAMMLAQSKLDEILLTGEWQFGDTDGEFDQTAGDSAENYAWRLAVNDWQSTDFHELTLTVYWSRGIRERAVELKTVVSAAGI